MKKTPLHPIPSRQEQDLIVLGYLTELRSLFARYEREHKPEERK